MSSDASQSYDRWVNNLNTNIKIFKKLVKVHTLCELIGSTVARCAIEQFFVEVPQILTETWQYEDWSMPSPPSGFEGVPLPIRTTLKFRNETALSYVVEQKNVGLTRMLIARGVDVCTSTIDNDPDVNNPAKQLVLDARHNLLLTKH